MKCIITSLPKDVHTIELLHSKQLELGELRTYLLAKIYTVEAAQFRVSDAPKYPYETDK